MVLGQNIPENVIPSDYGDSADKTRRECFGPAVRYHMATSTSLIHEKADTQTFQTTDRYLQNARVHLRIGVIVAESCAVLQTGVATVTLALRPNTRAMRKPIGISLPEKRNALSNLGFYFGLRVAYIK
jgi:hypothetical protein